MVLFVQSNLFAQNQLSGQIIDKNTKEALVGVYITIPGSDQGTATDNNGKFNLDATVTPDSIHIYYVGYQEQTMAWENNKAFALAPSNNQIDQIVVSASRESQNRKEVPAAISTISSEVLEATKATSLEQVVNKVNGVHMVDLGNEQHSMSMRQPLSYGSLFLYLEDGLPIRTTGVFNHNALIELNMANLNRIEFIKGPASSLYGSGAIGGAINFITHKPTSVATANVKVQGNNLGYKRTDFKTGNTWGKFGIVASGYYADRSNGPRDHSDFNKLALTLRADYHINPNTIWTNSATYVDYKTDMTGGLDSTNFYSQDFTSLQTFTYRTVEALRIKSSLVHYWNTNSKTNFTGFIRNNAIGQNPHYRVKDDYQPWSGTGNPLLAHGEINVNSFKSYGGVVQHQETFKTLKTKWISGVSIDYSPNDYSAKYIEIDKNTAGLYTGYAESDSLLADYQVGLLNTAAYTQLQITPLKNLNILGAVRYDRIDYNYDNNLDSTAFSGAPDGTNGFNYMTPKIGVTYNFKPTQGVYANYSIGFAPPEVSELYRGVTIPSLNPSTFSNYEFGGWISFLKNKAQLEVNFYRLDGINEIISVKQDDGSTKKENAGKTQHQGIEYTLKYAPIDDLAIRVSGANAQHTFVDFIEEGNNFNGNKMSTAPEFIANSEITYLPRFFKGFSISMEWQRLGKYYLDNANTEEYDGFNLINLRMGYTFKQFNIWVNTINLANENYANVVTKSKWGKSYNAAPPRTFNIGLGYKFSKSKK